MPFSIGPKIHNVIPKELKNLIEGFFSSMDWNGSVYLTGETCLAEYYFGHRLSNDMDLYSLDAPSFDEAKKCLKDPRSFSHWSVAETRATPHLVQFLYTPESGYEPIKIDLMLDIAIHLASANKVGHVWVDSLEDLLSNKMGCLVQRNEPKDYLDLYYLLPASRLSVSESLDAGKKKEAGLDPLIVANQMEFILHQKPPEGTLLGKTDWKDLQAFFRKFQKECLQLIRS